jgi:hypothetical protein
MSEMVFMIVGLLVAAGGWALVRRANAWALRRRDGRDRGW